MADAKWAAMTCVQVKRRASIVEVRLNRPEKMNAINSTMEKEFYSVLADCDRMDDVKCVVLTAEGANFSSGHDVQQVAAETIGGQEPATIQDKYWVHTGDLLPPWRFSKGLVVAAKGYVGPHANTFLLAADVVIAADNSRFSWEESRVGVGAPYGPYALMPFHFPIRVMKQLWMTGGWLDAETAHRLFYVNRVVALGEEEEMAMRFAEQIARMETGDLRRQQTRHAPSLRSGGAFRDGRCGSRSICSQRRSGNRQRTSSPSDSRKRCESRCTRT